MTIYHNLVISLSHTVKVLKSRMVQLMELLGTATGETRSYLLATLKTLKERKAWITARFDAAATVIATSY